MFARCGINMPPRTPYYSLVNQMGVNVNGNCYNQLETLSVKKYNMANEAFTLGTIQRYINLVK